MLIGKLGAAAVGSEVAEAGVFEWFVDAEIEEAEESSSPGRDLLGEFETELPPFFEFDEASERFSFSR